MNFILLSLFIFRETICEDVVSAEKKNNMPEEKPDKNTASVDPSLRRFKEDLNDEEWHVSHLKDNDFSQRSGCAEETFVHQYRRALKNDGALVEYVSADVLKPDESDLLQSDKCPAPNKTDAIKISSDKASDMKLKNSKISSSTSNISNAGNESIVEPINTATTFKDKPRKVEKSKSKNLTAEGKIRRSDYQFSSVEYYDEVIDFNAAECPNAVQVVVLEIDQLRNYDVECESIIEWKSLDNA